MRKPAELKSLSEGEFARIAWLSGLFSKLPASRSVSLGIGDDAAVLRASRGQWVWTIDACVQAVHFDLRWLTARDVGWRSFHAAASDIAAMGAVPVAALCSLALPQRADTNTFRDVARGQAAAARSLKCPIIGGNMTRSSELSIHTTVLGVTKRPLRRDGARVGDEIWLLGQVGAAAAGLITSREVPIDAQTLAQRWCARQWRRPTALIDAGKNLGSLAHAAIDVSDGLVADLRHIAEASRVRAVIHANALHETLASKQRRAARELGRKPIELALFGGEDYALLATGSAHKRPLGAHVIGRIETGSGVWLQTDAALQRLSDSGFDHFR